MFETECDKLEHLVIPSEMMANIEDDIPINIFSKDIQSKLEKAAKLLKNGEVVAIPTETVYGLAGNALDKNVVPKIFKAKNRPSDNPLIVHISSLKMLKQLLPDGRIPEKYIPVIHKYWPGPLTIILPKSSKVPDVVTAGQGTMAVRFPNHPIARALISLCGFPLAAPSANSSGKPSPTLASHVYNDLSGKIPLIIDGGSCNLGVESTVLDGLRTPPAILRPGSVTYEKLKKVKGMETVQVYRRDFVDKKLEQVPTTPGMKYRHYSPDAAVVLIESNIHSTEESYKEKRKFYENALKELEETTTVTEKENNTKTKDNDNNSNIKKALKEKNRLLKEHVLSPEQYKEISKLATVAEKQNKIIEQEMEELRKKEHNQESNKKIGILRSQSIKTWKKNHSIEDENEEETPSSKKLKISNERSESVKSSPSTNLIFINGNQQCIEWEGHIEYFMGDRENPADIARELFKALRFVDKLNVSTIFVEGIEDVDEGLAIMNRIRKASSKIIKY